MSKNTNIADLINYISVDGSGNVVLTTGGQVATQSYVTTAVSNLVNAAPSTLDTLNELAAALGNDANFATTVTTSIATKQAQLNGTGFVKVSGTTVSYDNSTYLTTTSASSNYVTLATLQTISGLKTFDATISANYGIALLNGAIPALTSIYYAALSGNSTGISITYRTGGGTNYTNNLNFPDLNNSYLFPSTSGTLALTSSLSAYLPLTGGTLTGALSGTSATFSGTSGAFIGLTINNTDATGSARLRVTSTGGNINDFSSFSASHPSRANQAWIGGDGSSLTTVLQAGGTEFLRGTSTGAATFSGLLTTSAGINLPVNQAINSNNGRIVLNNGSIYLGDIDGVNPTGAVIIRQNGANFIAYNNSLLTVTGAATFSSSIFASSGISTTGSFTSTVGGTSELRLQGGGYGGSYNTSLRSIPGAIGVLQFGNNNDNYILVGNTAAGGYLSIRVNVSSESTTSGIEAMRITSGGNVGIGTTTPAGKLDISGGQYNTGLIVRTSSDNGAGLNLKCTDVGGHDWYVISTGTGNGGGAGNLGFYSGTNGNYLMYIKGSNGNVGIGTSSPATRLHIEAPSQSYGQVRITSTSANTGEASINIGRTDQSLDSRWTVGQGTASIGDTFGFYTAGSNKATLTTAGVWNTIGGGTSDARTKDEIDYNFDNGIESILKLQPTKFKFKSAPNKQRRGFIAQDVLETISDLVLGDGEIEGGTYGLDYDGILALAVKAIQEQQAQIEELKAENDELREILNRNNII